jgi:hypothetical protein
LTSFEFSEYHWTNRWWNLVQLAWVDNFRN